MAKEVYFSIDENSSGMIQLSINGNGTGYRICGPKYDGMGRTIRKHILTPRDVEEIKRYLARVSSPPRDE